MDESGKKMAYATRLLRTQLNYLKPMLNGFTLETARAVQDSIGALQARTHLLRVRFSSQVFKNFVAEWVVPKLEKQDGVILYLHGGGYVSGDVNYVRGFGSILATKNNIRVFCPAYRLAPEYPYPAALEDAVESYQYLLSCGYAASKIMLCGESAGGGLLYALSMKLQEMSIPLPCGIIAISPWTDLTLSGESYEKNKDHDPSLTKERLQFFVSLYTEDSSDPFVSPLFGSYHDFPPSLIFVGGSEILLDDAVKLHERLISFGNRSELVITPDMWHVYILYGISEAKQDYDKLNTFIKERMQ